jgi:hypothetical protein
VGIADGAADDRRTPSNSRATIERMSSAEERRRARAQWPIRRIGLRDEPLTDSRDPSTVDERIALVWTLTQRQWLFAGLPMPTYTRATMPGSVLRRTR